MQTTLISLILAFAAVFAITSIMILQYLKSKGEKASLLWIRLFLFSYVNKYMKLTKKESGKIGHLFYWWVVSINLALLSAVLMLISV